MVRSSTCVTIWAFCLIGTLIYHVPVKCDVTLHIRALFNKTSIVKESFYTNVQENTVVVRYQLHGGLICYAVYDFNNQIKIFKVDVIGEPELGEKHYQSICFVKKLHEDEFIPAEAVSKLRQKTAGSIQQAKEKLSLENFDADMEVKNAAELQGLLGDKFDHLCSGQESVVYAKESDLLSAVKGDAENLETLKLHTFKFSTESVAPCTARGNLTSRLQACICKMPFVIPWYPCDIKYCSTTNPQGQTVTTRCGIRSCSATYRLGFIASHPAACHWGVT